MARYSTRNIKIKISGKSVNREFKNLDIRATISKSLTSVPNQAIIEVFNLNKDTREELFNNVYDLQSNTANISVEFTADNKSLFIGNLINVNSVYSVPSAEWKTVLFCGDGFNATRAKVDKKYPKGTTRGEIVDDLMKELEGAGVAVKGAVEGITQCANKSILKAILVNGEILDNMKKLYEQCFKNVEVYVDDEKVNVLINGAIIKNNIVTITDGLLDPPTLNEQGVQCKIKLDSTVKIGAEIKINSKSSAVSFGNLTTYKPRKDRISGQGIYRINEIKHTIDNFSGDIATTEINGLNTK